MQKPLIISIVDDDEVHQFTTTRTIQTSGVACEVLTFSDGEEAIDFLTTTSEDPDKLPDIIFLDINMPIMDGWQFLEAYIAIKPKMGKKITIYMISSSVDPADTERAKAISELSDYIVKPITPERFKELLNSLGDR
jgi:CheY-like chemotaxis protein